MTNLKKIDDYRWEIPKGYVEGMRVSGIIYSNEEMMQSLEKEQVMKQIANVACLPGIVKHSFAMPDAHWGYGFAIGGVAATDPEQGGVISPGGVGYDINCICGNSMILHELGYHLPIESFEKLWTKQQIKVFDFKENKQKITKIVRFLKQKPRSKVYKITTKTGKNIIATEDHPFYTKDGMTELKNLSIEDEVAIYSFEGLPYEEPSLSIIIDENKIKDFLLKLKKDSRGHGLEQIIIHLKKRNLLPLKYDSPHLPYLLKVMGYMFGDGTIYFTNKRGKGVSWFYGKEEDLEQIREDIKKIGYNPSRIYIRYREHQIKTTYSTYKFKTDEISFKVVSSSFAALLCILGCPLGNKRNQDYRLPKWISSLPLWQKRLFLASYFGAEMSSPKTITNHGYNFYSPIVSLNKSKEYLLSGKIFLQQIASVLNEMGIKTNKISQRKEQTNVDGKPSYRLRLILSGSSENLIDLYSKVGFEYNAKRSFLANTVTHFLKLKQLMIEEREETVLQVQNLRKTNGWSAKKIHESLSPAVNPAHVCMGGVNLRFIERSVYEQRKTSCRVSEDTPTFSDFLSKATESLGESGMVWDKVVAKEKIEFDDYVYDFTVTHPSHNFVANNFIISNCGIRLLKTNLKTEDIKNKIPALMDALFTNVPCGVGIGGKIKVSPQQEKELLKDGSKWAVKQGFGVEDDIINTEEGGCLQSANPDKVSPRAYERGKNQSGTLGSGNHFLEIQKIDEIYDEQKAKVFGIEKNQITIMIHSGSRGLGHQICDDSLRIMQKTVSKYGIKLPDRQLVSAPVDSPEGKDYFSAMASAANYAWCNRQILMHLVRETFGKFFGKKWQDLGMELIYDVAHNIAKLEKHKVNGKETLLCVHRKGATRAFPPNHPDIPLKYKSIGQPVIIPGDMGRASYLLAGTQKAFEETWGSTCHGAGRTMSRHKAIKIAKGRSIFREMEEKGITVRARNKNTLAEEMSEAYKDINMVVDIVHKAGISQKVAKMKPLGVIKG